MRSERKWKNKNTIYLIFWDRRLNVILQARGGGRGRAAIEAAEAGRGAEHPRERRAGGPRRGPVDKQLRVLTLDICIPK